jgi:signal-transduction protein with cAMP-binding, CBS, and nucleotidyltransferase domain
MQAIDVGRGRLCTVDRRRTIGDVARLMAAGPNRAVVVVDAGRAVGIVTDRDLVVRAMARGLALDAPVESVMTPDPVTAEAGEAIETVQQLLRQHGIRQVPLTREGLVVGIVGMNDLVFELNAELRRLLPQVDEASEASR